MKRRRLQAVLLVMLVVPLLAMCDAPFLSPPVDLQQNDLVGIWNTSYGDRDSDRLVLRSDGTFRQIYRDPKGKGYTYATPWNRWRLEQFPDGRVHLHLEGARYYSAGIEIAELDGLEFPVPWTVGTPSPFLFYDPVARDSVAMPGELVLNVRCTQSGELLLMHMWRSSDRGFAIIGGDTEIFHRIAQTEEVTGRDDAFQEGPYKCGASGSLVSMQVSMEVN